MNMTLEEDLKKWEVEKPLYEELMGYIKPHLKDALFTQGYAVSIEARVKDDYSMFKKINIKRHEKGSYSYEQMTDKLGIRIICRFKEEIPYICKSVDETFDIQGTDDFYETMKYYEQGYKGVHKDAKLKGNNPHFEKYKNLIFEVQIRTLCDNVWAVIYHDIGYKPEIMVSNQIKRNLHCLAGSLEVADICFSDVNNSITKSSELTPDFILNHLTKYFYKFFRTSYDMDYSIENITFLKSFLPFDSVDSFKTEIDSFIEKKKKTIKAVSNDRRTELSNPLITQPEVLLIFYLIEKDKHTLWNRWEEHFCITYLDELSTWWGDPIYS
jgi:putative GTP pyrophosphokinase